jgi:hypothetical protein
VCKHGKAEGSFEREKLALLKKAKEGDKQAREDLIT